MAWARIALGSNSPMRFNKKLLRTMNDDDIVLAIHKLVQTLKPDKDTTAEKTVVMPLKDRTLEIKVLQRFFKQNMDAYEQVLMPRKQDHNFAVITAGRGVGKTRLCQELPNIVSSMEGVSVVYYQIFCSLLH